MTQNDMFLLDVANDLNYALVVKGSNEAKLWHLRYGHLKVKGLRVLNKNGMVVGLPKNW